MTSSCEVMKLLLDKGANPAADEKISCNEPLLVWAVRMKDAELAAKLIARGVDVNEVRDADDNGSTCWHDTVRLRNRHNCAVHCVTRWFQRYRPIASRMGVLMWTLRARMQRHHCM